MKLQDIKLFADQPPITQIHLDDLEKRGLIVPSKSPRKRANCEDEITNETAGEVVSYFSLSQHLKTGRVSQDDARRLLAIESMRQTGWPRDSHVRRLIVIAVSKDRTDAEAKIQKIQKQLWVRKAK